MGDGMALYGAARPVLPRRRRRRLCFVLPGGFGCPAPSRGGRGGVSCPAFISCHP